MITTASLFPDVPALTRVLASLLPHTGPSERALTLLERKPLAPWMTFPAEIVTCCANGSGTLRLFCKHEAGRTHNSYGHRGGLTYEAEVYRRVLQQSNVSTAKFYGAYKDSQRRDFCLVLGYLEGGVLLRNLKLDVKKRPQPTPLALAARWLGRFHAANERRVGSKSVRFLNRYDLEYYQGWARRMAQLCRPLHNRFPWLSELCSRAGSLLEPLLTAPQTIIHGEYYHNNIIVCGRKIYPTDWESAAIAPGEIDLASLTEGHWKPELVHQCKVEYRKARWPHGAPAEFERRLEAAGLYLHFRWLGERPDWTTKASNRWRYEALRATAASLGIQ
jgi:phosphotransferase family enzyme